jgi:oligopeptide/dipeptide ABC transporter ATP-binding protein
LRVENLATHFAVRGARGRLLRAVDGVSLTLETGGTLGIVGESGCGKSTLARTILRLIPATAGRVFFGGHNILELPHRQLRPLRRAMQIIFQDPAGSLNPRLRIETIIGEGPQIHGLVRTNAERRELVAGLLARVGLHADDMDRFPHEFSGGQRQRIGIARALAVRPRLVVCDEPVSALDVSIQSQILNLLADLRDEFGLSYLFISHDLAVVRHFCDEIAVMYFGKIVEQGPADRLIEQPRHPYTRALLAAAPNLDATARVALPLGGEVPDAANPPSGCAFHPRCPIAIPNCSVEAPSLRVGAGDHAVACDLAEAQSVLKATADC